MEWLGTEMLRLKGAKIVFTKLFISVNIVC